MAWECSRKRNHFSFKGESVSEKISGIYQIVSIVDGKTYVGQSIDVHRRKRDHFRDLRNRVHGNVILQKVFHKYGEANLEWKIIDIYIKSEEKEAHWLTRREAEEIIKIKKTLRMNLATPQRSRLSVFDDPVYKCDSAGMILKRYKTIREASIDMIGDESLISHIARCSTKSVYKKYLGFKWAREKLIDKKGRCIKRTSEAIQKYFAISLADNDEYPSSAKSIVEARSKWGLTKAGLRRKLLYPTPRCGLLISMDKKLVHDVFECKYLIRRINQIDNDIYNGMMGGVYITKLAEMRLKLHKYETMIPELVICAIECRLNVPIDSLFDA